MKARTFKREFTTKSGYKGEVTINIDEFGEGSYEVYVDKGTQEDYYLEGWLSIEGNELVDYDGCFELPKSVTKTLTMNGITC